MSQGWIGVDLDGTLAEWVPGQTIEKIGKPILPMMSRVLGWLREGREVRIVTARVANDGHRSVQMIYEQRKLIENWCTIHIGKPLEVTAQKDFMMVELWDDRAHPVETNTGRDLLMTQAQADVVCSACPLNMSECLEAGCLKARR